MEKEKNSIKKPIYKKWWFWVIIIIVLAAIFGRGGAQDGFKDGMEDAKINETQQATETENEVDTTETEESEKAETTQTDANGWTDNNYAEFVTITQQISDEYVANYKAPWGYDDWTFAKFDDEGKIIATTKYTFDNMSEKQDVMCVFTVGEDADKDGYVDSYKGHYLSIGNKVYLDDGSCDEFFENLESIANPQ